MYLAKKTPTKLAHFNSGRLAGNEGTSPHAKPITRYLQERREEKERVERGQRGQRGQRDKRGGKREKQGEMREL